MKVAVFGSSGFLGSNLSFFLGKKAGLELVGISRTQTRFFPDFVEYKDLESLERDLQTLDPKVLINCAAMTSHEMASSNPESARQVNSILAGDIAGVASRLGIRFCQISTDAVYSGTSAELNKEEDSLEPQTAYGISKLLGEQLVADACPDALVIRTNFFGWSRDGQVGVLDFFYNRLSNAEETVGFADYRVSSLYVGDLADVLNDLLVNSVSGVFNVSAREPISKYEFGVAVAETFGLDTTRINVGSILNDSNVSARGLDLGLETGKVATALGRAMPSTLEGIQKAKKDQEQVFTWFGRKT